MISRIRQKMKYLIPIPLVFFAACAAPTKKPHDFSARVISIRQGHDSYSDGRFAFYSVVNYEMFSSGRIIERIYDPESPELKSLAVGEIVNLKE